jgi:hypothetical protein
MISRWPRASLIAVIVTALALVRIAATYRVFSATIDEATHVGAGLELLQFHEYRLQRENPPIPPIVMAVAPWLGGMRFSRDQPWPRQLHGVFYDHGKYERNLVLARVGNLLFFALSVFGVWLLARDDLGDSGALLAVLLFTMEPIVLGYSALATHEAATVMGLVFALLAFRRWLRDPGLIRALLFGFAYGLAVLCKTSCIAYVPAACLAMAIVRLVRDHELRRRCGRAAATMFPAAGVTFLTIWAGYAFTTAPRAVLAPYEGELGGIAIRLLRHIAPSTLIPAPDFFIGIALLIRDTHVGIVNYLCGQAATTGWWWYFPFAVALKTTLATLVLFLAGAWMTRGEMRWTYFEWAISALAIVAVAMTSSLDIGVRYVLPFYAPFAIAVATAALALLRGSQLSRGIAIALLALQIGASLFTHPDYFPYFNALAGPQPSRYLIDSNLDWGQDVLRLRKAVRDLGIRQLHISIMGVTDYGALGFPPVVDADPWHPVHGWIAVSEQSYRMSGIHYGWEWLRSTPYRRIGTSIRLYWIP